MPRIIQNKITGLDILSYHFSVYRTVCIALILVLNHLPASSLEPRFHGFPLDSQYRLQLEENAGNVIIRVIKKERLPGGPEIYTDPDTDEILEGIRYEAYRDLFAMQVEVLETAPPNYLRNPGLRYEITLNGLAVAPDFNKKFQATAANVLDRIQSEMAHVATYAVGIDQDAIYYGTQVALAILNESGYLPTHIQETVKRSEVGQHAIQGEFLLRGEQPRVVRRPAFPDDRGISRETASGAPRAGNLAQNYTMQRQLGEERRYSGRSEHYTRTYRHNRDSLLPDWSDKKVHDTQRWFTTEPVNNRIQSDVSKGIIHATPVENSEMEKLEILVGPVRSPLEQRGKQDRKLDDHGETRFTPATPSGSRP